MNGGVQRAMTDVVWNVHSYPDGEVLHVAATYEAADRWRHMNNQRTFICPEWPKEQP